MGTRARHTGHRARGGAAPARKPAEALAGTADGHAPARQAGDAQRPSRLVPPAESAYLPIEQYGVVGDLHTIALVGVTGSIDFLCYPTFDSPTVFGALLDAERGGRFLLAPLLGHPSAKQIYLPDSNVLLTRCLSEEGVAEISDFMPVEDVGDAHTLVRRVKTVRGEVRYRLVCAPRFGYGRVRHRAELRGRDALFVPPRGRGPALRLRSEVPLRLADGDAAAEFTLRAGETAAFVLGAADGGAVPWDHPAYVPTAFKDTLNFWRRWIGRSTYRGRWREIVDRSALLLKLLVSRPHGSIVAAPTFGLPETVGGVRNWDYRYTWIRDAAFTVYALMRLGYMDEAGAFINWIEARCADLPRDGALETMYRIDGRPAPTEQVLPHLEGYRGSRPVRIGNAAAEQLQLDSAGELIDSVYLYNKYGEMISYALWEDLVRLARWVTRHWREADNGIWEVRGGRRRFMHSRLMCWVALDRMVRIAEKRSLPGPVDDWRETRDKIFCDIQEHFWNAKRKAFVQSPGVRALDAASLLVPLVRFLGPTDPRWLSTLRAIETDLVDDSLVHRYRMGREVPDNLPGAEGTFTMCSFWYVECLSRAGDIEKARFLFEKMLGYANHLGLYAEQLGTRGEHLGNFPQAFTHLSLISAAYDLNRRLDAAGQGD